MKTHVKCVMTTFLAFIIQSCGNSYNNLKSTEHPTAVMSTIKDIEEIEDGLASLLEVNGADFLGEDPQNKKLNKAKLSLQFAYEFVKIAGKEALKGNFKSSRRALKAAQMSIDYAIDELRNIPTLEAIRKQLDKILKRDDSEAPSNPS